MMRVAGVNFWLDPVETCAVCRLAANLLAFALLLRLYAPSSIVMLQACCHLSISVLDAHSLCFGVATGRSVRPQDGVQERLGRPGVHCSIAHTCILSAWLPAQVMLDTINEGKVVEVLKNRYMSDFIYVRSLFILLVAHSARSLPSCAAVQHFALAIATTLESFGSAARTDEYRSCADRDQPV